MSQIKTTDNIGEWIKQERKRQGLTQKQLSGLLGISERLVGELERGKPTAEIGKVLHILNGLGAKITLKSRGEK